MKYVNFFLVLIVVVGMTGCVTLPPLMSAADRGDINAANALLDKGADVNEWNYGTALIFASSRGHTDMVKLLIDRGADVNAMFKAGSSALGLAATNGYADIVEILIAKGADIDRAITGMEQMFDIPDRVAKIKRGIKLITNKAGWAYYSDGQHQKAINAFKKAISVNPSISSNFNGLSRSYYALKQYGEAMSAAKRAIELGPGDASAHNNLGWLYFQKEQYDEASKAFKKAIELDPGSAASYSALGWSLLQKRDYKGSATYLKRAVELAPDNKVYLSALYTSYYLQDSYEEALETVNKFIDLSTSTGTGMTTSASLFGFRSLIQRHRGKPEDALKDAEQAYSLDSSDKWAKKSLGAAYLDQDKYAEAIKLLVTVKNSIIARILEATAHAKQGELQKAIDIYSAIPEEKLSRGDRTALFAALAPYAASKEESASALQAQGRYKEALNELGEAMGIAGDAEREKILAAMSGIIGKDPRLSVLPEEAVKFALRGDVMTEEGDFEEAAKQYRRAVNAAPYIARLHFNTAMVYGELQKYPQAVRSMQTYLLLAPEAPNARAVKNQIYKWEFKMERGE